MYTLYVGRYKRYMRFETVDELRVEVSSYFTRSEQNIVDKLCTFDPSKRDADGLVVNKYQDFLTDCYVG